MPPWEKYQAASSAASTAQQRPASGPWNKYAAPAPEKPAAQISTAEDVAKSAAGGLERGVAGTVMILPNLINQAVAGPQLLGRGIAEGVDKMIGIDPQPRGELWQPFMSSEDVLQKLPDGLKPHDPQTAAGAAADLTGQLAGSVVAGKAIQKAGNVLTKADPVTSEDIRAKAHAAYADAEAKGGVLPPSATDAFIAKADTVLPQTQAGKLVLGDTPTTKLVERLQSLKGNALSLAEAQEIDSALGEAATAHVDPKTGKLLAEGKKLQDIQTALRDAIETANLPPGGGFDALKQARGLWAQSARLRDIENIISRAEMTDNPATAIKTGFRNLANNPARMRGFSDEEAGLIKSAAESGVVGDMLKTFGSRLIPIIAAGSGGGLTGTAAAEAASLASRGAATKLQVGRAEKVAEAIANRGGSTAATPNVQPAINPSSMPSLAATAGSAGSEMNRQQAPAQPPTPQPSSQQPSPPQPTLPVQPTATNQPGLIDRIAQAESSGNPEARNPYSTASGLLQFTNDTWARAVAKWGKQTGITLKDKNDPQAQATMGQLLAEDNARILSKQIGREPTDGEIYAAHFLGAPDAVKLINAAQKTPDKQAILLYPRKLVGDNRAVFFDGKRPRSVSEVYQLLNSKVAA